MEAKSATHDALASWPADRSLGLLVIARAAAPALASDLKEQFAATLAPGDWWWLEPENAVSGDSLLPNYHWAALREYRGVDAARACLALIRDHPEGAGIAVHLARPAPQLFRGLFDFVQRLLARLPIRISEQPLTVDERWLGGVNPSAAQIERIRTLPQDEPVGVLNMHRFNARATDPYTGEATTGRALGHRYMRRGLLTFTRVGGHISWAGAGAGQLHGPAEAAWHELALVWYPGRGAFDAMSNNPAFHRVIPYRKAGLSLAEVSMARISAGSRVQELRA